MKNILIAGGTGLIGQYIAQLLTQKGYQVSLLSRKKDNNSPYPIFEWNVERGTIDEKAIAQADAVINLAGAGVADARWTAARKKLILESRTQSNQLLKKEFEKHKKTIRYISAAAIGYYGNRGAEILTEASTAGNAGFLPECCIAWENSIADVAALPNVRGAMVRVGTVLSTQGGALEKMLPSYKVNIGAYFGDGKQIYSWIHIADIANIFIHLLDNQLLIGIYNGTSPNPVSNYTLAKAIGKAMNKNTLLLPVPKFALQLALGEMSSVILDGANISSQKIQATGFQFQYADIEPALRNLITNNS
jgi:uncharacterized protein (TIGR01777 family)